MRQSLQHLDKAGITPDSVMLVGRTMWEATLDLMSEEEIVAVPKLEHLLTGKIQAAEHLGEAKLLLRLLQRRFGLLPAWAGDRVAAATPHSLEEWSLRLLDAQSLEEVFADATSHEHTNG
ncbi:MAG: DUF4351 domain-containing protein [Magnetococcales bacterium]|nr:DUF4351 domain-containing protein [Magnetococcales bacterium]